ENLDWLCEQQGKIEKQLFRLRYKNSKPPRLFLYDVTSSYLEGLNNELAEWGYNRDGKKGKLQIVIGLLTDGQGVPVSVEVFRGNTHDTKTFLNQVKKLAGRFEIKEVTIVGDRGMIKSAQIEELKEEHFSYISAITKPQIEKLIKKGVIQLDLFNEQICEVEDNGIRYILRRNPVRAEEIAKTREEKIKKVQTEIKKQNEYLSKRKRAKLSVAKLKIEQLITKLKITNFTKVDTERRGLS
ncbi:MAG: IS1634 family transposase, partial [Deltaproteobacteria bacterium]|nr:IS1634 family transposase [Deltaproteobacteria bacterium]